MRLIVFGIGAALAVSCASGDPPAAPEGACANAPYLSGNAVFEAIADGCNTCDAGWWQTSGSTVGSPAGPALASLRIPAELEEGTATWGRALDGRILITAGGAELALDVPGLEASDLAWMVEGEPIFVLRDAEVGSLTLRREDGRFIFQSQDSDTPFSLPTDLAADEGLSIRARGEATCTQLVEPCWAISLRGPVLSGDGLSSPVVADVGETGRAVVAGRGFAFRGTYGFRSTDVLLQCADATHTGQGATWLVATSE